MPPKPNEGKIVSCDFELKGQLPKQAFELFAVAQAKLNNLRGYIMQVSEDTYRGQIQGEGQLIEAFRKVLMAAAEYVALIKEFAIKNMKAIQEYTYETFEVKKFEKK